MHKYVWPEISIQQFKIATLAWVYSSSMTKVCRGFRTKYIAKRIVSMPNADTVLGDLCSCSEFSLGFHYKIAF